MPRSQKLIRKLCMCSLKQRKSSFINTSPHTVTRFGSRQPEPVTVDSTTPLVKNERVKSRRPTAHASRFVPVQKLGSDGDVRAHPDDKTPLISTSTSTSSGSHQPEIACPLAPWWLAPDGAPDADAWRCSWCVLGQTESPRRSRNIFLFENLCLDIKKNTF